MGRVGDMPPQTVEEKKQTLGDWADHRIKRIQN